MRTRQYSASRRGHSFTRAFHSAVAGLMTVGGLIIAATPAAAVEPLWGEMPLTLGKGTFHPNLRSRYLDARADAGRGKVSRMRMFEQELMLEYAPSASLNLRLDIPYQNTLQKERIVKRQGTANVSGLGDMWLRAKQRVSSTKGEGWQSQQSIFYGLKLPTGRENHFYRLTRGGRHRLDPIDQTGTGNPGILLGYGWTGESLAQASWASVTWKRDIGGGFRLGDSVEINGTYGPWLKQPNEAEDLGVKLSFGVHGLYHFTDYLGDAAGQGGSSGGHGGHHGGGGGGGGSRGDGTAGNSFGYLGFHVTPVVTKGNYIFQAGIFVPVVRRGVAHRTDFPYEIRLGIETYF